MQIGASINSIFYFFFGEIYNKRFDKLMLRPHSEREEDAFEVIIDRADDYAKVTARLVALDVEIPRFELLVTIASWHVGKPAARYVASNGTAVVIEDLEFLQLYVLKAIIQADKNIYYENRFYTHIEGEFNRRDAVSRPIMMIYLDYHSIVFSLFVVS